MPWIPGHDYTAAAPDALHSENIDKVMLGQSKSVLAKTQSPNTVILATNIIVIMAVYRKRPICFPFLGAILTTANNQTTNGGLQAQLNMIAQFSFRGLSLHVWF